MESASAPEPQLDPNCVNYRSCTSVLGDLIPYAVMRHRHTYECDHCLKWVKNTYPELKAWINAMLDQNLK